MTTNEPFELALTSRVVSAWGALALLKRMLVALDFKAALGGMQLPPPGSNRGYAPEQLIEPMIVSICCGAAPRAREPPPALGLCGRLASGG